MKNERAFGLLFAAVFVVVALWPLASAQAPRVWALIAAAALVAVSLAVPAWLAPAARLWLRLGALMHAIVSPVILALIFYAVVLPTGLVVRALGKDLLRLRFNREARSYWIRRDPPGPGPQSFRDQF